MIKCYVCGSTHVHTADVLQDGNDYQILYECNKCGSQFYDNYKYKNTTVKIIGHG